MILKILITLLVVSIILLLITVFRDKKYNRISRSFQAGRLGKQTATRTASRGERRSGSVRGREPVLSTKTLPNSDSETDQKEFMTGEINAETDSDTVLGLKPKPTVQTHQASPPNLASLLRHVKERPIDSEIKTKFKRVIIYLKSSKQNTYGGYDLLQTLLSHHFRFGDMDIFHRYERNTGEGKRLFSLAAATKMGTFDLTNMGAFFCPGLSLFFNINEVENPLATLDLMLETATQLTQELGGEVLDEHQNPISKEKIQQWHDDIKALNEVTLT